MGTLEQDAELPLRELERQVALVVEAIERNPSRERQILTVYISNFFDAVKETLKYQGRIMPFYVIMSDPVSFGVPPVTEEIVARARSEGAAAVVSVEGFQSETDISDLLYHVSMSAPSLGVLGWVFKVKLRQGLVEFDREMPYFFDSSDKVKTLGELISMMERDWWSRQE